MKYFLSFSIFLLQPIYAQSIIETFKNIPDSVCPASKYHREKIINQYVSSKYDATYKSFKIERITSSYIKIIGGFDGTWELKKWKISKNNFLIGVVLMNCGPVCGTDVYFYRLQNNSFAPLNTQLILPSISSNDYYNQKKMIRINDPKLMDSSLFTDISWVIHFNPRKKTIKVDFEEINSFDSKIIQVFYTNKNKELVLQRRKERFEKRIAKTTDK